MLVQIYIVDYIIFPKKKGYKSDHIILDTKTYERDLQDFSFTFIELLKFKSDMKKIIGSEEVMNMHMTH